MNAFTAPLSRPAYWLRIGFMFGILVAARGGAPGGISLFVMSFLASRRLADINKSRWFAAIPIGLGVVGAFIAVAAGKGTPAYTAVHQANVTIGIISFLGLIVGVGLPAGAATTARPTNELRNHARALRSKATGTKELIALITNEAATLRFQLDQRAERLAGFASPPEPHEQAILDSLDRAIASQRNLVQNITARLKEESDDLHTDTARVRQLTDDVKVSRRA